MSPWCMERVRGRRSIIVCVQLESQRARVAIAGSSGELDETARITCRSQLAMSAPSPAG